MKDNFAPSLAAVLKSEGGNDDDPVDRGGRTSRGITQREYTAWLMERGRHDQDVWTASTSDISTIYHDEYWNPYCDNIPKGIDYDFFDLSVNHGPGKAIQLVQRALGVADDGRIGPVTRDALARANPKALIPKITAVRKAYYDSIVKSNPSQKKYIKGWYNRAAAVEHEALAMV